MKQDRWITVTGPMAFCIEESCKFRYHGDGDRDARKAFAQARKHVRDTGHEVRLERGQSAWVTSPS